jgi:hypothetical protein
MAGLVTIHFAGKCHPKENWVHRHDQTPDIEVSASPLILIG